jgi:predicted nucleic acid-binding protein
VRFWDASAIVPLLVSETSTRSVQALAKQDSTMLVWWGSEVECASALARIERDGALEPRDAARVFERLRQLSGGWQEIEPSDVIRQAAIRFLRVHPLRAADALQLAAAYAAAEQRPASLDMVTLDERLAIAARKEGFVVLDAESLS